MSCKQEKEEVPEEATEPVSAPFQEREGPLQLEMVVKDEANESDTDALSGGEKFFIVQQSLSNGVTALFIADNHNYDSPVPLIPDTVLGWLGGSTFAKKAQSHIKQILLDSGNALKKKVCDEDTVQERRGVLITEGLTKGTLVLFKPAENTWDIYMQNNLSDGFFDDYEVTSIKRDDGGFVKEIILSKFLHSSITVEEEGQNVNSNASVPSREDVVLVIPQNALAQKSLINLEQYMGILDSIQGLDGQFASCSQ